MHSYETNQEKLAIDIQEARIEWSMDHKPDTSRLLSTFRGVLPLQMGFFWHRASSITSANGLLLELLAI